MSEALSVDDFVSQLTQADQPEQPPAEDSSPAEEVASEEGLTDAPAEPETEGEQPEQPQDGDSERVIAWTTANGDSFSVTEDELKSGYLRQQDYTRKAQEVAQERERAKADLQQQVQVVTQFADAIGELKAVQGQLQQFQNFNWDALEAQDPAAASRAWRHFQTLKERAGAVEGYIRNAKGQWDQQQQQSLSQGVAAAEQHLTEKVKGVNRDEVLRTFKTLSEKGADQRVIDIVRSTPALAEMAIYAQRWVELQGKKPQAVNKAKELPPVAAKARQAAPTSKAEEVAKTVQNKRTFSTSEFAKLLKATR